MIYCVIPRELEDELFEKMVEYYKDNPNVTVILDRREGDDRRSGRSYGGARMIRARLRPRASGSAGHVLGTVPLTWSKRTACVGRLGDKPAHRPGRNGHGPWTV